MWLNFKDTEVSCRVFIPEGTSPNTLKGIVLLGLDNQIIWNPYGRKSPSPGQWVWGVPEEQKFITYINSLWGHGFMPILYSENIKNEDLAQEVQISLVNTLIQAKETPYSLPIILGLSPTSIHGLLTKYWVTDKEVLANTSLSAFSHPYGANLEPNFTTYSINGAETLNYTFEMLGFRFQDRLPASPSLLILVGEQGSGKSTIAEELKKSGFTVYPEKEAAKLQLKQVKLTNAFRDNLNLLKIGKIPGIVIDATNAQVSKRQLYINLATTAQVPYIVGWVTRPGWESNKNREKPIPAIALNKYISTLEPPTSKENAVRLI